MMSDTIYYCIKGNNDCPKQNECERYIDSDAHNCKTTLFKTACTDDNNRILFIKAEHTDMNTNDNTKDGDKTE